MIKKMRIRTTIGVLLLLLMVSGCTIKRDGETREEAIRAEQEDSQAIDHTITYDGKKYVYNEDLLNILFLGIDTRDPLDVEKLPGKNGQSDCVMLLSLDTKTKEGTVLQINRNTMTDIDVYNAGNTVSYTGRGQLTLQYACANGGSSSAWATKKKVREILYGLPIDAYLAMDLTAINEINNALGGVDITMSRDYTEIDESFQEGETVHLEGDLAERFVRYRDTDEFDSVSDRMSRQVEYVTAMVGVMKSRGRSALYDVLSPFLDDTVITDMSAEQINALAVYDYNPDQTRYLPGEEIMGEIYEEYIVDEEELQKMIIESYYVEAK